MNSTAVVEIRLSCLMCTTRDSVSCCAGFSMRSTPETLQCEERCVWSSPLGSKLIYAEVNNEVTIASFRLIQRTWCHPHEIHRTPPLRCCLRQALHSVRSLILSIVDSYYNDIEGQEKQGNLVTSSIMDRKL